MVVTVQYLDQEDVSSGNDLIMVFSGAQTVRFEDEEDPEVIWDSGSKIALEKNKNLLEDIKGCKVTMCSNGGNKKIER